MRLDAVAGSPASLAIANVAFDKAEATPLSGRHAAFNHAAFNFLKISAVPRGKIIETDVVLLELREIPPR
jgi:hypothetical protein